MSNIAIRFPLTRRAGLLHLCVVLWGRVRPDPGFMRRLCIALSPTPFTRFHDLGEDAWHVTALFVRFHFTRTPVGVLTAEGC